SLSHYYHLTFPTRRSSDLQATFGEEDLLPAADVFERNALYGRESFPGALSRGFGLLLPWQETEPGEATAVAVDSRPGQEEETGRVVVDQRAGARTLVGGHGSQVLSLEM